MKDIIAGAANIMLTQDDDGNWRPSVEVIVVTNEPEYHLDEDFELKHRRRKCEQIRFVATENILNKFIETLEKARFELQNQETAAKLANKEKVA